MNASPSEEESPGDAGPLLGVYDHQACHALEVGMFRRFAQSALPFCLARRTGDGVPLAALDEIEISFVDDATIARVHVDFMNVPGATDVITFDHGEILISTETAAAQAGEHGNSFERELATYVAHGLLHLAGHGDKTPGEFEAMRALQEEAVAAFWS